MTTSVHVSGPDEVTVKVAKGFQNVTVELTPAEALALAGQLTDHAGRARRKALGHALQSVLTRTTPQEVCHE